MPFATLAEFAALVRAAPDPDPAARAAAAAHGAGLTKPAGALGRLEDLVVWIAGWQGQAVPALSRPGILVFAGNHGVAARGVSAFPAAVTAQMVANFAAGGAAINQLAGAFGAELRVHPLDLDRPTGDFTEGAAMDPADCVAALRAGWAAVEPGLDLVIPGEMGIGNTTAAAALAAALWGGSAEAWVGRGTGVDDAGLARKAQVVAAGLACHRGALDDPLEALRRLGGREIAAIVGAIAAARARRIPVLLDGFIVCAAAGVLLRVHPGALAHCQAGHLSAEGAHGQLLDLLGLAPLLSLGMRLGEGSGGALALGVLRGALACHAGMASFAQAGVSPR